MSDDWRLRAACRGMAPTDGTTQPHPFFPATGEDAGVQTICADCPVRQPCMDAALRDNERGIWGGESERGRRRRRQDERLAPRTPSGPVVDDAALRRAEVHRLFGIGHPAASIAMQLGIDRRSVYRLLDGPCIIDGCWCAAEDRGDEDGGTLESAKATTGAEPHFVFPRSQWWEVAG